MARKLNILVYAGPGAVPTFTEYTINILSHLLPSYTIQRVTKIELRTSEWLSTTSLVVIPGGHDRPYIEDFLDRVNDHLIKFVYSGGKFLGIGAGAYYASEHLIFTARDPIVDESRPLKFYPGTSVGPTFPGFNWDDDSGARAISIMYKDAEGANLNRTLKTYYHGGGSFLDAHTFPTAEILATYEDVHDANTKTAAVLCSVGQGSALLTHFHIEYLPIQPTELFYNEISPYHHSTLKLWRYWLDRLGLEVAHLDHDSFQPEITKSLRQIKFP